MKTPYFSIILPVYNSEYYIVETVRSILNQSFQDFEVIIVDDCSTDNTINYLESINDIRFRVLKNETNKGPSFSRNLAISHARGDWIVIIDSDDLWDEKRLEVFKNNIQISKKDIYFDNIMFFMDGEPKTYLNYFFLRKIRFYNQNTKPITLKDVLRYDLGILQPVIRREQLIKNKIHYNSEIKYGEDLLFISKCLSKGLTAELILFNGYYYRDRPNSLVKNKIDLFDQIVKVQIEILSLVSSEHHKEIKKYVDNRINEVIFLFKFNTFLKSKFIKKNINNSSVLNSSLPINFVLKILYKKIVEKIKVLFCKKFMATKVPI